MSTFLYLGTAHAKGQDLESGTSSLEALGTIMFIGFCVLMYRITLKICNDYEAAEAERKADEAKRRI